METQLGKQSILEFRTLHVGGYLHTGEDIPHFVGQLQQIWFNGYPYLEIARSAGSHQTSHQGVTPIIRVTGKFGKRNHPVHHPVTFTSKHTFVGLPVLKAYVETNIYFQVQINIYNNYICNKPLTLLFTIFLAIFQQCFMEMSRFLYSFIIFFSI